MPAFVNILKRESVNEISADFDFLNSIESENCPSFWHLLLLLAVDYSTKAKGFFLFLCHKCHYQPNIFASNRFVHFHYN